MAALLNRWREGWRRCDWRERLYWIVLALCWLGASFDAWSLSMHILRQFRGVPCDAAVTQNALINILHGHWFRETPFSGPNVLGIHSHFVFLLLAPIYALIPSLPFFLWLQQAVALSLVWPLYLIARQETQKPLAALLVALLGLFAPMLINQAAVPFHPEPFGLPALFWAYSFYLRNRPVAFALAFVLAASCGEHAAITFTTLGLAWRFGPQRFEWTRRFGGWAIGGGIAWMILAMVVLPAFFRTAAQYDNFGSKYAALGVSNPVELFWWMISHPATLAERCLDAPRWARAFWMVGLLLPLAFLSWEGVALLLQLPLYWLMNRIEFFLLIHNYYFQFLFLACLIGLVGFVRSNDFSQKWVRLLLILVLFINGVMHLQQRQALFSIYNDNTERPEYFTDVSAELARIPREAGVYGPHRYAAQLSNRLNMVIGDLSEPNLNFENMMESRLAQTDVRADQIDYIVVDILADQCGTRVSQVVRANSSRRHDNVQNLLNTGRWKLIWNQHYVVILQRKSPTTP